MAMCMPSGSFMGYENWEEILHQKFLEEEYDDYSSETPKSATKDVSEKATEDTFGGYTYSRAEYSAKIAELQEKIDQVAKQKGVNEHYIKHMQDALSALKYGDVNSAIRLLIVTMLELNENRPGQEAV